MLIPISISRRPFAAEGCKYILLQSKLVLFLENQQSPIDLGLNHKDNGLNLPKHGLKAKDLSIQDIDHGIYLIEGCHEDVDHLLAVKDHGLRVCDRKGRTYQSDSHSE